jgi:predicted nucleotidyltransferase
MRSALPIPQQRIAEFCRRWKIAEFSIFGSVLRADFGPDSDVDVLFQLLPGETMSIERYLGMRDELVSIFGGRAVDLVEKPLLHNPIRRREILRTREVLYAAA